MSGVLSVLTDPTTTNFGMDLLNPNQLNKDAGVDIAGSSFLDPGGFFGNKTPQVPGMPAMPLLTTNYRTSYLFGQQDFSKTNYYHGINGSRSMEGHPDAGHAAYTAVKQKGAPITEPGGTNVVTDPTTTTKGGGTNGGDGTGGTYSGPAPGGGGGSPPGTIGVPGGGGGAPTMPTMPGDPGTVTVDAMQPGGVVPSPGQRLSQGSPVSATPTYNGPVSSMPSMMTVPGSPSIGVTPGATASNDSLSAKRAMRI